MPAYEHLQQTFRGGALSPRLRGAVGAPFYSAALAECSDWEITPQGSLRRRGGSIFASVLGNDPRVKFVPFPQSDGQDFVLVLTQGALRVYSVSGAQAFQAGATGLEFLVNGDFSAGGSSWTLSENTLPAYVRFASGDLQLHGARTTGGHTYRAAVYQEFTSAFTVAATLKIDWKSVKGHVRYAQVKLTQGATTLINWTNKPVAGGSNEWAVNLAAGSTYRLLLKVELPSGDFDDAWTADIVIDSVSLAAASGGSSARYELVAPWTGEQLRDVYYALEPGLDRVYFVHPGVHPWYLQRAPSTGAWTWAQCPFTSTDGSGNPVSGGPAEWVAGNYPSVVQVWQGRLWLAATPAQGNTVWSSKSLDRFNLASHEKSPPVSGTDQVLDSSAIVAPLATKGRVRWMHGRNMLLIGTDEGEYSLTASGGTVKPSDMQVRQESGFGACSGQSIDVGGQVVYVSRDRRKVRPMDFSLNLQAWVSRDLTFLAEHLTQAGVLEVHHARDPNDTVIAVLADGTAACCTYSREEQVAAWWPVDFGGEPSDPLVVAAYDPLVSYVEGDMVSYAALYYRALRDVSPGHQPDVENNHWVEIEDPTLAAGVGGICSAAVMNGPEGSVLCMAVQRKGGVYFEMWPMAEAFAGRAYCDSSLTLAVDDLVPEADGTVIVSGLDHLEGQTVEVILDGSAEGQQVVAGGQVVLARAGTSVIVGLPFTAEAVTLPPTPPNQRGQTALRARRRWVKCFLRLNDSALPLVEGDRPEGDRSDETPLDAPEPSWTGDVGGPVEADWETRGALTIQSDTPLRTEILAIFGSLEENEI